MNNDKEDDLEGKDHCDWPTELPEGFRDNELVRSMADLPSVAVGKILSYLSWKDKLSAGAAISSWSDHLHSADAWLWFRMDDLCATTALPIEQINKIIEMTRWCIRHHGKFFQNCIIWLCCRGLNETSFALVDDVGRHCVNIKTLRIYHTSHTQFNSQKELEKYIYCLNQVTTNCLSLRYFALCSLDYLPLNRVDGMMYFVQSLVCTFTAWAINELEFFHPQVPICPVLQLASFINLRKLKCPIQTLNTEIILTLKNLRLLFLVVMLNSGEASLTRTYDEFHELRWTVIAAASPSLEVHYMFRTARLDKSLIVPNPLVHTLILGVECQNIADSVDLIKTVTESYGRSLRCFVQLCPCLGEHRKLPTLYAMLVNGCPRLQTFLVSSTIPAAAISLVAANRKLCSLWIEERNINFKYQPSSEKYQCLVTTDDLEYVDWWETSVASLDSLQQQLTKFLGFSWQPLTTCEMLDKVHILTRF